MLPVTLWRLYLKSNVPNSDSTPPPSHSYDKFTKCLENFFNTLNISSADKSSGCAVVKRRCKNWMDKKGGGNDSCLLSVIFFFLENFEINLAF